MQVQIHRTLVLTVIECADCGVPFGVTERLERERREDRANFYCPNGHSQWFPGKTPAQLVAEERARTEAALATARQLRASLDGALEEVTKAQRAANALRTRVGNGVCPDCHRTFKNVALHARSKHKGAAEAKLVTEEMKP